MSSTSSGGNGKGALAGGIGSIPAASRKVVQSLKEIVNSTEAEIYATLRECNMDPNEAVNRLLTQDPFREVKSKREKKKENKDTTEYKPRGTGNARGGRGGTDRRAVSTPYNFSESGNVNERPAHRKENGAYSHDAPYSTTPLAANADVYRHSPAFSNDAPRESKLTTASGDDSFSSSSQTAFGFQSAWGGGDVGRMSMADIVKKGRPQSKAPGPVNSAGYVNSNQSALSPALPHHAFSGSKPEVGSNQHKDEWPVIEHPPVPTFSSICDIEKLEPNNLHTGGGNQNIKSVDALLSNDVMNDNYNENNGITTAADISLQEDKSGDVSYYDNNVYEDPDLYQQYGHAYEQKEAEASSPSLSSMAATMQQLRLEKEEHVEELKEETRSVVIPDHLQVQSSECLNLSFGSFGAGIAGGLSSTITTGPFKNEVEEQPEAEDASPVLHSDSRNPECHGEEDRATSPEDLANRSGITAVTQTSISPLQPEVLKQETPYETEGEYTFHSSLPGYNFDNSHQQQLNPTYLPSQASSQAHNSTPFSNVLTYANLSPDSLLATSLQQPIRESDLSYSQFHANQLMASKVGKSGSVSVSSASGAEAVETSNVTSSPQVLPGANVAAAGPGLPQHLTMHPCSQHTLPPGPFTNMISYPFLPQSYTYMPSGFQQAFGGNSSYHQSLAAVLPQYKNNLSVSSLPQSGAVPSGYGAFGRNSISIPGNFSLNQNAAPGGSTVSYDELMSSHYKEQLLALQQTQLLNENPAMYAHGNSRTMSAVPTNTYYNFQGQNLQPGVFRQTRQQPSQHLGSPGYPNLYHSQSGMSMEHQQQNPRDGFIGGSQVQPSKQLQQQMWQNGY